MVAAPCLLSVTGARCGRRKPHRARLSSESEPHKAKAGKPAQGLTGVSLRSFASWRSRLSANALLSFLPYPATLSAPKPFSARPTTKFLIESSSLMFSEEKTRPRSSITAAPFSSRRFARSAKCKAGFPQIAMTPESSTWRGIRIILMESVVFRAPAFYL